VSWLHCVPHSVTYQFRHRGTMLTIVVVVEIYPKYFYRPILPFQHNKKTKVMLVVTLPDSWLLINCVRKYSMVICTYYGVRKQFHFLGGSREDRSQPIPTSAGV